MYSENEVKIMKKITRGGTECMMRYPKGDHKIWLYLRSCKIVSKLFLNYALSIKPFSWVLRIDSYEKFPKFRTKNWSKSIAKFMSSEKCNFGRIKVWNRNFCKTRMIVFDLDYILLGWFSCSKYASQSFSSVWTFNIYMSLWNQFVSFNIRL